MNTEIIVEEIKELEKAVELMKCFADSPFITYTDSDENIISFAKKQLQYGHVLAVFEGNEAVGYICFYANDQITKTAFITSMVLGGLGLAKGRLFFKLLEKTALICIKNRMTYAKIQVDRDNDHARKVYEKLGFVYTGEEDELGLYMLIVIEDFLNLMRMKVER